MAMRQPFPTHQMPFGGQLHVNNYMARAPAFYHNMPHAAMPSIPTPHAPPQMTQNASEEFTKYLLLYFSSQLSLQEFCNHLQPPISQSVYKYLRFRIDSNVRLQELEKHRNDSDKRKEAKAIIKDMFRGPSATSDGPATEESPKELTSKTRTSKTDKLNQNELKNALHRYFSTVKDLQSFCDQEKTPLGPCIYQQLRDRIDNHERLKVLENQRSDVQKRQEAMQIIHGMFLEVKAPGAVTTMPTSFPKPQFGMMNKMMPFPSAVGQMPLQNAQQTQPQPQLEPKFSQMDIIKYLKLYFSCDLSFGVFCKYLKPPVPDKARKQLRREIRNNKQLQKLEERRDNPISREKAREIIALMEAAEQEAAKKSKADEVPKTVLVSATPASGKDDKKRVVAPVKKEQIKLLLHQYFMTELPLRLFCKSQNPPLRESVRKQMWRIIKMNNQLRELVKERDDGEKRKEAIAIIDKILPGPNFENSLAAIRSANEKKDNFFTPANIARIAAGLDFSAHPRKCRTGNGTILINTKQDTAYEKVRTLALFLYKEVIFRHRHLTNVQKEKVLADASKIVMYDHGYQEARGYKQILRLYERSMINCLKTGMGATSLIRSDTVGEEEEETKMMEDEELCPCGCQQIMKKGQFLDSVSGYVKDVA
jgi:hypothetical protein